MDLELDVVAHHRHPVGARKSALHPVAGLAGGVELLAQQTVGGRRALGQVVEEEDEVAARRHHGGHRSTLPLRLLPELGEEGVVVMRGVEADAGDLDPLAVLLDDEVLLAQSGHHVALPVGGQDVEEDLGDFDELSELTFRLLLLGEDEPGEGQG